MLTLEQPRFQRLGAGPGFDVIGTACVFACFQLGLCIRPACLRLASSDSLRFVPDCCWAYMAVQHSTGTGSVVHPFHLPYWSLPRIP